MLVLDGGNKQNKDKKNIMYINTVHSTDHRKAHKLKKQYRSELIV
ncbi:MAG: hypothetical protein ACI8RD_014234 [Bacillariaceae sp.]|jgi:hypothetical protein